MQSWLALQLFTPVGIGQNQTTSELIFMSSDTFLAHSKNAYSSEELNGLSYYQNSVLFQLQWGFAPWLPDQGLCPWTPLGALPLDPRYKLALRARHVVLHCLEEIAATATLDPDADPDHHQNLSTSTLDQQQPSLKMLAKSACSFLCNPTNYCCKSRVTLIPVC